MRTDHRAHVLIDVINQYGIVPKRICEIGVHRGKATKKLRAAFPKANLLLVDPWLYDPKERDRIQLGTSQQTWDWYYRKICKKYHKHRILRCTGQEAALIVGGKVDVVFIDAPIGYDGMIEMLNLWVPKVRTPGLVAGHDWHQGRTRYAGQTRAINELLTDVQHGPETVWWWYKGQECE